VTGRVRLARCPIRCQRPRRARRLGGSTLLEKCQILLNVRLTGLEIGLKSGAILSTSVLPISSSFGSLEAVVGPLEKAGNDRRYKSSIKG